MTCCVLILLWVQDEFSYDRFHRNADRVYRILSCSQRPDGSTSCWDGTPGLLASTLQTDYPEIEKGLRFVPGIRCPVRFEDKKFYQVCGATESSFFEIFSFPFVQGNARTALNSPGTIVLTETAANKYFGSENALGKSLKLNFWRFNEPLKVTGVIKDVPLNTHFRFDCLIHFSVLRAVGWDIDAWGGKNNKTYVLLGSNANQIEVENKIRDIYKEHYTESSSAIRLEPITRIHLYDANGGGAISYVYIFITLGIFILLIACVNFMNLSTARSSIRAKEVGMRKVIGANRQQLRLQFLGESTLMSLTALGFAVLLARIFLPLFNNLAGKQMALSLSGFTVIAFLLIALFTGIVSGVYPAIYLSSFQPQKIFKGNPSSGKRTPLLRKGLVVFQFTVSIFLIITASVVFNQLKFIRSKELGFQKDHVLSFQISSELSNNYLALKQELLRNPDVLAMTVNHSSFLGQNSSTSSVSWEGMPEGHEVQMLIHSVDFDYKETFGLKLSEGRFFSKDFATDMKEGVVLNEAAVRAMGIEDPIGKKFFCPTPAGNVDGKIIGVMKDYHVASLHSRIQPLVMVVIPGWYKDFYIRIRPDNVPKTLAFLEAKTREIIPEYIFEYTFLDERIENLYKAEMRQGKISQILTGISIIISCLGLFGLVSFTSERRTKEIGIRKVLGASIAGIIRLLSKEFLVWVLVANLFAWPLAYYFLNKWLQNFAFRVPLEIGVFIFSGLLTLIIALLTVTFQTARAASANPVDSLRYE
jgi:putative ABC transport system permease protein